MDKSSEDIFNQTLVLIDQLNLKEKILLAEYLTKQIREGFEFYTRPDSDVPYGADFDADFDYGPR